MLFDGATVGLQSYRQACASLLLILSSARSAAAPLAAPRAVPRTLQRAHITDPTNGFFLVTYPRPSLGLQLFKGCVPPSGLFPLAPLYAIPGLHMRTSPWLSLALPQSRLPAETFHKVSSSLRSNHLQWRMVTPCAPMSVTGACTSFPPDQLPANRSSLREVDIPLQFKGLTIYEQDSRATNSITR